MQCDLAAPAPINSAVHRDLLRAAALVEATAARYVLHQSLQFNTDALHRHQALMIGPDGAYVQTFCDAYQREISCLMERIKDTEKTIAELSGRVPGSD